MGTVDHASRKKQLNTVIEEVREQVVEWRRHFHRHPELSFEENGTSQYIHDTLLSFGNLEVTRPTKTSVMARLIGDPNGKVLALRADIDALPIQEESGVEFTSENSGVMHACAHDGHAAMLLGAAKVLSGMKEQIRGEVRFLFQHAEEYFPGGAGEMVAAGVLDGVDWVVGSHLMSMLEKGKIGITYGPKMASTDGFMITIQGHGGHGGMPHQTVDAVVTAAQAVTNLQSIVSRNVNPLDSVVITVGTIEGGSAPNVVADKVKLSGTIRYFNLDYRETMKSKIERVLNGVTEAHGATYELEYMKGYYPVINDKAVLSRVEETVRDIFGDEAVEFEEPAMGAEDFSAFMVEVPGAYYTIGAGNEEVGAVYPHHHPKFRIDEDALEMGTKMFVHTALKFLGE